MVDIWDIRPHYIGAEGCAGVGKTSARPALLNTWHSLTLRDVIHTREPGGTANAEAVRARIFEAKANHASGIEIVRMFYEARVSTIKEVVVPNLRLGNHVLTDRYAASTFAYEGGGERVSLSDISEIHRRTVGNFGPDITYYFRLRNPMDGIRRKAGMADLEPFDHETEGYHHRVQQIYDMLYEENRDYRSTNPFFGYWVLIEADKSRGEVDEQIKQKTIEYLSLRADRLRV